MKNLNILILNLSLKVNYENIKNINIEFVLLHKIDSNNKLLDIIKKETNKEKLKNIIYINIMNQMIITVQCI